MELIKFIFQGFWYFLGSVILITIIADVIKTIVVLFCEIIKNIKNGRRNMD